MEVIAGDFGLEWKRKDGEIHKADYDDLIVAYEKQEEYDKEIRGKAIEEFAEKLSERLTELSDNATICGVKNVDFLTLDTVIDTIRDINAVMRNYCYASDRLTTLQGVPCIAEIRNRVIEEALEKCPKAICAGCGYLNDHECTYNGANCAVSKPMLEAVTKALEQMKEVGE